MSSVRSLLSRRIYKQIGYVRSKLSISGKNLYAAGRKLNASRWKPFSRLILAGDTAGWSLDWDMRELSQVAYKLGIHTVNSRWQDVSTNQSVFQANQFFLLNNNWLTLEHRIGLSYFHGLPNTGEPLFDQVYMALSKHHERISRIQVSHNQMREVILYSGIDAAKIFLIPIGINLDFFNLGDAETKITMRRKFNIPQSAFVIGSFQKDGNGWGEGLEPKLVKGPDVFLSAIKMLKNQIPELFVLLSGPARGYVKAGLESMGVPYMHRYLDSYPQIGELYQTLNLYVIASRQEGGPKAVLECMASGVPLISTRVGQATDLIQHGQNNAWLVDLEDSRDIANWALQIRDLDQASRTSLVLRGRATAEANCYDSQLPLWKKFMEGFVA